MTNEEILKKAIEKAVKGGYYNDLKHLTIYLMEDGSILANDGKEDYRYHINEILFDHSFAKAFWGDKEVEVVIQSQLAKDLGASTQAKTMKNWEYHLMKMVLKKEPLKYIERFLK